MSATMSIFLHDCNVAFNLIALQKVTNNISLDLYRFNVSPRGYLATAIAIAGYPTFLCLEFKMTTPTNS